MLSPDTLGTDLISRGQEVIIHLSCKDWNRNALESRGWKLGSEGFDNVLALSGDYPVTGHRGLAAPVFDIDSVGLLSLFSEMNEGLPDERRHGVAARPHGLLPRLRRHEPQAARARGDAAVLQAAQEDRRPARASSSTRSAGTRARTTSCCAGSGASGFRSRRSRTSTCCRAPQRARFTPGKIPGSSSPTSCSRSPSGTARARTGAARSSSTSPPSTSRSRAASASTASTSAATCRPPRSARSSTWRPRSPPTTGARSRARSSSRSPTSSTSSSRPGDGLSSDEVNAAYLESKRTAEDRAARAAQVPLQPTPARRRRSRTTRRSSPPDARSTGRSRRLAGRARLAHALEQAAKVPLFGCRDCGDCSLPEIAYVCPESQCAKNQRNGPCGGTRDGLCEVYDTECIWSQAYERLKAYGEEETMLDGPVVIKDNALAGHERVGEHVPRPRPPWARGSPYQASRRYSCVEPRISYAVGRLERVLRRRIVAALEPDGLTAARLYDALSVLRAEDGMSNAQLARRALVTPQSMNEVLNLLVERGFVRRRAEPGHGRILRTELDARRATGAGAVRPGGRRRRAGDARGSRRRRGGLPARTARAVRTRARARARERRPGFAPSRRPVTH